MTAAAGNVLSLAGWGPMVRLMPELAEVEFFRRRWDPGVDRRILEVQFHADQRIFRGVDAAALQRTLTGATLLGSEARGKQMLFQFSRGGWLGVHLGMTGELRVEPERFLPGKHDHLRLRQRGRALVFADPRLFGRIRFDAGRQAPSWWTQLPPPLTSAHFTVGVLAGFLQRRKRSPLKGVLLDQSQFPGVGNWMADEILWRARLPPAARAGELSEAATRMLWKQIRFVCAGALRIVAKDYSDPPASWLFPHRWAAGGHCPRDGEPLERATIGGRTTAWCPGCQPRR